MYASMLLLIKTCLSDHLYIGSYPHNTIGQQLSSVSYLKKKTVTW